MPGSQQNLKQNMAGQAATYSTPEISTVSSTTGGDVTWRDTQQTGSSWRDSRTQQTENIERGITISSPSTSSTLSQKENIFSWKDHSTGGQVSTAQQSSGTQQVSTAQQPSGTQQVSMAQQSSGTQQSSSAQQSSGTQQISTAQQSSGTQQKSEPLQTVSQGTGQRADRNGGQISQSIQSSEQRLQKTSDTSGTMGTENLRAGTLSGKSETSSYQRAAGEGQAKSAADTGIGQSRSNQTGITKEVSSGYTGQVSYQGSQRSERHFRPEGSNEQGKQAGRMEGIRTEGQSTASKEISSEKKENKAVQTENKRVPMWGRTGETPEKPSLVSVPRELKNIKDFNPKKQDIVEIKTREITETGKISTVDTQRNLIQDWNKQVSGGVATKTDSATKTDIKTETVQRTKTKADAEHIRPEQVTQGFGTLSTLGKAFKMLGNIVESIKPALAKEVDKIKSSITGSDRVKSSITGQQVTAKGSSIMGQQVDTGKFINTDNIFRRVNAQINEAINLFDKKNAAEKLTFQEKGAFITKDMISNRKKRLDPDSLEATEAVMGWDKTDYVATFPTEVHQDANLELKRLCQMCQIVVNVDMVLCPSCAKLRRGLYDEMEPYFTRLALIKKQKLEEKNKSRGVIQEVSGIVVRDKVELSTEQPAIRESKVMSDGRSKMTRLDENTLWCNKKFALPEGCKVQTTPSWAKDYISNKTNNLEHSLSLATLSPSFELLARDSVEFPLDIHSITTRLNESISRDNIVEENRTSWKKEGIKRRERIYSQGLVETVTKWGKSDIKQTQIRDRAGTFDFSNITRGKSLESNIFNCGDLYIEESKNYDTDTNVWKYRGKNRFLVHCSFPGENGNRVKYTRLDEGNISRIGIDYDDGRRHIEIHDPSAGKKASITTFDGMACQIDYSSPSMTEKTIIHGTGRGINTKTNSDGEKVGLAWMPLNEVIAYKKEYADGTVNKCYYYDNKATRQMVSYGDGNSYDLLELPGEVTKKLYKYQDGTGEEVTVFEDNKTRRTVKYPDSSVLSEVSYGEDRFKLGMKYGDGTSYLCKNWGNGTTQQCFCWPGSGVARVTTGFDNDSIIERRTFYGDGSATVETKAENWETDSTKISEEVMNRNILESPLFDLIASPSVRKKLMEDPFHNPLLTIDTQLWAQIQLLQSHGKKALIKSIEKIHSLRNSGEQKMTDSSDNENLKNYFNAIKHINNTTMDSNPE